MFWKNKKKTVGSGPRKVDKVLYEIIGKEWDNIPQDDGDHWVKYMAVMRPQQEDGDTYDVRIYDEGTAEKNRFRTIDYDTFDQNPELILFEGWFNRKAKKGEIKYTKARQAA